MLEKTAARSAGAAPKDKAAAAPTTRKPAATKRRSRTAAGESIASTPRQEDLRERVQRRAYELWENEGRPAGREHDHWLQAEREIASTRGHHAGVSR